MKAKEQFKIKNMTKYVRINPYTWIEKRKDESDEVARNRFLNKLYGALENTKIHPGFNT